jgi:CheY-like chemotaxis protein
MSNPKARLLVVDDEALVCRNLSIIFAALGYATRAALSGFSALEAIRKEIPDIILSDLNMPGMSGFELLSVVRRRFPSIRVVAMSGAFSGKKVPPGIAADAFYEKGTGPTVLLRTVEAMMRSLPLTEARPLRSPAPIWIPTNGHDPSGEPYVMISCPECLRTFPQILERSAVAALNTKCAHCSSPIQYAIVHSIAPLAGLEAEVNGQPEIDLAARREPRAGTRESRVGA